MQQLSPTLVQIVSDNFKTKKTETAGDAAGIRRLTTSEMKQLVAEDVPMERPTGPKKPQCSQQKPHVQCYLS